MRKMDSNIRGRCRFDNPDASCANNDVVAPCAREAERMASRILISSFLAIISAAFPFGARMIGTWPYPCDIWHPSKICNTPHSPMVTTALKRPLAIRSISSSICCSVEDGELRSLYDVTGFE